MKRKRHTDQRARANKRVGQAGRDNGQDEWSSGKAAPGALQMI
jgi:hypothetical protein